MAAPQNTTAPPVGPEGAPAASAVATDEFGLPFYAPRDTRSTSGGGVAAVSYEISALAVPWHLRPPAGVDHDGTSSSASMCESLLFLSSRPWWDLMLYALRVSCVGILPLAAILSDWKSAKSFFLSSTLPLLGAVPSSQPTVGQAVQFLCMFLKGVFFWLPLATAAAAIDLTQSPIGWCFAYVAVLFVIGVCYDGMARKICQLMFSICMVGIINNRDNVAYPSRVFVDWIVGTFFGVLVPLVPYPLLAKDKAATALRGVAADTATCFLGLGDSFWATSSLQRNVNLMKLRSIRQRIVSNLNVLAKSNSEAVYEVLFDASEARQVRDGAMRLFDELQTVLDMQHRVIELVVQKPELLEQSDRATKFGRAMQPVLKAASEAADVVIFQIGKATTIADLQACDPALAALTAATAQWEAMFERTRLEYFYRQTMEVREEYIPVMSAYLFTHKQFTSVLQKYLAAAKQPQQGSPPLLKAWGTLVFAFLTDPMVDLFNGLRRLLFDRKEADLRLMVEAMKTALSMLLAIGFFFLVDTDTALISGPSVIAFVSSSTQSEAVQGASVRLVGALLGSVFGFFATTLTEIPRDRVAALCLVIAFSSAFRQHPTIGLGATYCCFVAINSINVATLNSNLHSVVSRTQQTTFAVLIYVAVTVFIAPARPREMLVAKRAEILSAISRSLAALMALSAVPFVGDGKTEQQAHRDQESQLFAAARAALQELRGHLKVEAMLVPLAESEPALVYTPFPVRANQDIHTSHKTMAAALHMLDRAWIYWRLHRPAPPSPAVAAMVRYLSPILADVSKSFHAYAEVLMQEVVRYGRLGLSNEALRHSSDISYGVKEVHVRKGEILLGTVQRSVSLARSQHKQQQPTPSSEPSASGAAAGEGGVMRRLHSVSLHEPLSAFLSPMQRDAADGKASGGSGGAGAPATPLLPADFVMPIAPEDSNGMHALTITLLMFAAECKSLVVNTQDVNRHWCE